MTAFSGPGRPSGPPRLLFGHHLAEPLSPDDRNLLNSLAFIGAEGRVLFPHEIRVGQKLEALGLCTLAAYDAQFSWGCYVSSAAITAAGLRAARIGEGAGPVLVCLDGKAVAAPSAPSHRPPEVQGGVEADGQGDTGQERTL